ncbi:MAG: thermonuclease family protein [Parachlamydiales bacterium]|jgi:endonuclease YncB( thermonuclease family)
MKKTFVLIFVLLSVCLFSKDKPIYDDIKVSKILSVHDGDTFKVNINEFPPIIGENISIRVAKIDTPEINCKDPIIKKKALLAKQFTEDFLKNAKEIVLKNPKRDKYFRIVAEVIADNKSLSAELIRNDLALPYDGKKKPVWNRE